MNTIPSFAGLVPTELIIKSGEEKTLVFSKLQTARVRVEEGAKLNFVLVATQGWQDLAKLTFELAGRHAEVQFVGFVVGGGIEAEANSGHSPEPNIFQHQFPFETISQHLVPETKGHYYLKAAMFGHSVVDYKGTIIIGKPAQLSDSYLAHHTLLMSNHARARSIPALEIEADDVKAGHAATIGKVEEELMFYLRSRGIDSKQAEQMLIEGFFADYIKMIHDEKTREAIEKFLTKLLQSFSIS